MKSETYHCDLCNKLLSEVIAAKVPTSPKQPGDRSFLPTTREIHLCADCNEKILTQAFSKGLFVVPQS